MTALFPGYHVEWVSSEPPARKGYAGTMILYKEGIQAEKIVPKIGAPSTMDDEGRLLVLDFGSFYFVNVYTPKAGDGLKRILHKARPLNQDCQMEYPRVTLGLALLNKTGSSKTPRFLLRFYYV